MNKKYFHLTLLCIAISFIIMALPFSMSLTFAPTYNERLVQYCSYFNRLLIGYAHFSPPLSIFFTGLWGCAILLYMHFKYTAWTLAWLGVIATVFAFLAWRTTITPVFWGGILSLIHLAGTVLCVLGVRENRGIQ